LLQIGVQAPQQPHRLVRDAIPVWRLHQRRAAFGSAQQFLARADRVIE
jgi:hypothetical protein